MDQALQDLATLIYLATDVECDNCHKQFAERNGKEETDDWNSEAEAWRWAQKAATDAYSAGWREVSGRRLCRDCVLRFF